MGEEEALEAEGRRRIARPVMSMPGGEGRWQLED